MIDCIRVSFRLELLVFCEYFIEEKLFKVS